MGCREAMGLIGRYLVRAATDASDTEAREHMMWAATLAGIAFGNAGVHVPHAMAYAVAGRVREYLPDGYPEPADMPGLVPHGFAVAVNAPAAFAFLEPTAPERHAEASRLLGGDGALNDTMSSIMRAVGCPNGTSGVGYTEADIPNLVASAAPQRRLLDNAPGPVFEPELTELFGLAERCW